MSLLLGKPKGNVSVTVDRKISVDSEVKRMGYEEIRELGILHEINRLFLHPLGLALAIMVLAPEGEISDKDEEHLVGLMYMLDDRDDPEGTIFAETALDQEKIDKFEAFRRARWRERQDRLGFVIQPKALESIDNGIHIPANS